MLIDNKDSIIFQAQSFLCDLGADISDDLDYGVDCEKKVDKGKRIIQILKVLQSSVGKTTKEQEILLSCLCQLADINSFPTGISVTIQDPPTIITGIPGPKGDKGDTGDTGPQGTEGAQGIQGIQGIQGDQGLQGLQGPAGSQGLQGDKGDTGDQGAQGIQGIQGIQGNTGPQGIAGIDGTDGIDGSGEDNAASNIGSGSGLFAQKNGTVLEFKSLVAGTNITLASSSTEITISSADTGEVNTASNLGSAQGIFFNKSGSDLEFKGLEGGSNVTLSVSDTTITINSSGEENTGSNTGTGSSVFKQKSANDLEFRKLNAGSGIIVTQNSDDITITSVVTSAGEVNTASNLGAGSGIFAQKNVADLEFKSLIGGTNVNLSSDANTITIDATDTGEVNTVSNLGTGEGLFVQKSGVDFEFKSLVGGIDTDISSAANELTLNHVRNKDRLVKPEINSTTDLKTIPTINEDPRSIIIYRGGIGNVTNVYELTTGTDAESIPDIVRPNDYAASTNEKVWRLAPSGEFNTASNLGASGSSIFAQKSGVDLQFRKLIGGTNVTLTENTNDITIDATGGSGESNTASNLGAGTGVFAQKNGIDLEFKSIVSGSGINITSNADTITITNSSIGEANTGSNLGAGSGVFAQKSGVDFEFKSIVGGTGINVTSDANTVTINNASLGETNTASNLGAGEGVFGSKSGVDLRFKSIVAGTNISLSSDANELTINATGSASGESNTASNTGTGGVGVFKQKTGVDLEFKNLNSSAGIHLTDNTGTDNIDIQNLLRHIASVSHTASTTNINSSTFTELPNTSRTLANGSDGGTGRQLYTFNVDFENVSGNTCEIAIFVDATEITSTTRTLEGTWRLPITLFYDTVFTSGEVIDVRARRTSGTGTSLSRSSAYTLVRIG